MYLTPGDDTYFLNEQMNGHCNYASCSQRYLLAGLAGNQTEQTPASHTDQLQHGDVYIFLVRAVMIDDHLNLPSGKH